MEQSKQLKRFTHIKNWRLYAEDEKAFELGHFYPSVTTVLDIIKTKSDCDFLLMSTQKNFDDMMTSTAAAGNAIHDAIQAYHLHGKRGGDYAGIVDQWALIAERERFTMSECEVPVFSELYGFAGTLDGVGHCDNKPVVFEIKTGQYKITAGWQAAAYRYAFIEDKPEEFQQYGVIGLQIHRSGKEPKIFRYQHLESCFVAFLSALDCWRMTYYNDLKKLNWFYLNRSPVELFYKSKFKV